MIKDGDDVNKIFYGELTILMAAALYGKVEIVKELVQCRDIDVNKTCNIGWTALMWASLGGNSEIVKELIKAGADVYKVSSAGDATASIIASDCKLTHIIKIIKGQIIKDISFIHLPNDIIWNIVMNYLK